MCAIKPIAAKLRSSYYLEQKGNLSALYSTSAVSQVVKKNGCQKSWINRRKQKILRKFERDVEAEGCEHREARGGCRNTPPPFLSFLCSIAFVHIRDGN